MDDNRSPAAPSNPPDGCVCHAPCVCDTCHNCGLCFICGRIRSGLAWACHCCPRCGKNTGQTIAFPDVCASCEELLARDEPADQVGRI